MTSTEPQARPRVEGDREQEILRAALRVLAEVGYDRLTMDAVATEARASKATLYRRWKDKVTLVIDALLAEKEQPTLPDTGSLRGDLLGAFCGMGGITDPRQLATFSSVLTAVTRDPEFAEAFRTRVIGPKIALTQRIYERARDRGEIRDDVDLEILGPALAGILLHRFHVLGQPPTAEVVARVVDQIILPAATSPTASNGPSSRPTRQESHD
ncbi:TetR/AcrR family transcriptional regulator [Nocardioides euryhalodurans]|uniref:TetR/AcrR family transcriptional regulator n=1 Tax=Nocardioides euryhalodurans TaxID=2518370 RepID=UPI001FC9E2EA|nr:TetR/AcrR family transcriptional regulator [Nocardioides euryhalodurans]